MKIEPLIKILGNLHHALEVLYVASGVKRVARLQIHEDEKEKLSLLIAFMKTRRLNLEISSCKYVINRDGNGTYYGSYSRPVKFDSKAKGFIYLYIAQSKKLSRLAKICEEHGQSDNFGRLLGYPACCVSFYNRHIQRCVKEKKDLIYSVLDETRMPIPYPFWNNFVARYFNVTLLSHYPCSFNCDESIRMAKERLSLIKSVSPLLAEEIAKELKSAIIVTPSDGIYKINEFLLNDNKISLLNKGVACLTKTYLKDIILESTQIDIGRGRGLVFLRKSRVLRELRGKNIAIFVFG